MEGQPQLVAAAGAVRAWIHVQRTSWPGAAPLPAPPALPRPAAIEDFALLAPAPVAVAADPVPPAIPEVSPGPGVAERFGGWARGVPWATVTHRAARAAVVALALVALGAGATWVPSGLAKYRAWSRTGTVVLQSIPRQAEIRMDEAVVGKTPLSLTLPVGPHIVEFRSAGATRFMRVDVARGRSTVAELDWNPRRVGTLQVDTTPPGASVVVDGKARGATPLTLDDVTVGAHSVVLTNEGGSVRHRVQIAEGQTEVLTDAIFPGWLHVVAPVDVTISEQGRGLQLDARGHVLLKAGDHDVRIESPSFGFVEDRRVNIEPGGTTTLSVEVGSSTLSVTSSVPADVQIDGVRVGATPLAQHPLKIGTHEVTVTDGLGNLRRRSVRVTRAPAQIDVDFAKP